MVRVRWVVDGEHMEASIIAVVTLLCVCQSLPQLSCGKLYHSGGSSLRSPPPPPPGFDMASEPETLSKVLEFLRINFNGKLVRE